MAECPTCGDDGFSGDMGVKIHHVNAHGESLAIVNLTCEYCGEDYEKHQSLEDQSERNFCSQDCYGSWIEDERDPEDAPQWKGGEVTVECEWCGSETKKKQHRVRETDHSFCSNSCKGEWISENVSGKNHPQYNSQIVDCENCGSEITRQPHEIAKHDNLFCSDQCRFEYYRGEDSPHWIDHEPNTECDNCGKAFYRTPSEVERYENNFCCHSCMGEWYEKNIDPEDHPRWEGGHPDYYGPTWPSQRRQTLERDEYECQDCGMTREEHYEQWDRDLEVHHKTPIRTFNDTTEANQLSNLVTLCKLCHCNREHA